MSSSPVPHNRWDLLPQVERAEVAVVVTHYEQHACLARVLEALAAQTLPPSEVVVADDGSASAPQVPEGVRLVRQEDRGFRAAAARNLGAAATSAPVVVFLDGDTVPEPGFLHHLVRRVAAGPDALAVGRRRHADLSGDGRELAEPAWLVDGYARTRDLLDADDLSWRYVISAALALPRALLDDLGGFDERYVGYGGEDWDLAYRAWNNGALLVHEREAVCWHDGPEQADREAAPGAKDRESARLAALVPHPLVRGAPLPHALPDVLVDLAAYDVRAVTALLRQSHGDLAVRVLSGEPGELHAGVVRTSPWTADQQARARVRLRLDQHVLLGPDVLAGLVRRLVENDLGELRLLVDGRLVGAASSTRALGRARRHPGAHDVPGSAFGRRDVTVEAVPPRADLAGFLGTPWRV